jgi:flap endonuclease-1
MGVKFGDLVIDCKRNLKLESLQGKKVAVDAFNVLYQFVASIRQRDGTPLMDSRGNVTSHLQGLFSRNINLLEKGIKLVYVFDGVAPELKKKTAKIRRERKEQAGEKYEKAVLDDDDEAVSKYSKQMLRLTSEMIEESKELVKAMGIPVIEAPSEAEAQCSYMCKKKDVYCVASQDYDCLLFGTPRLALNLTLSHKRKIVGGRQIYISPYMVELKDFLEKLELNQDELIMMGIMIGTDFNPKGLKGIGPKKALKLVGKSPDEVFKDADFDWKEIYDIFAKHPVVKDYDLKFGEVDEERVKEILMSREFSEDRIESGLARIRKKDQGLGKWM